jgi:(p)ppGpp synthase/HD superfamily hydrolase
VNDSKTINWEIAKSIEVRDEAHAGQFRRDGVTPYKTHPEAVAATLPPHLKPAGNLHDVPEDTHVTLDDLREMGFSPFTVNIISVLTHRPGDSNMVYWKKIMTNPDAVLVKIADIKHNLSSNPSEHAKEKYARALALFAKHGYSV